MDAALSVNERFKPRGFWHVLKDKTLLILASIICSAFAFALMYAMDWIGVGVSAAMIGISLGVEILRLRSERRWLILKIEKLEERLKVAS